MNTALLVITAVCVGGPALLAAVAVAWSRHAVIDAPDQSVDYIAVDAEDHGDEPSPGEQAIIDQLRATPLRLQVTDDMRDRAMARFRAQCLADIQTQAPRPVFPTAYPAELETPPYHDFERPSPLSADELAVEVAAYEQAAAERFRNAGVTWPTNPASVGIARYDDKAGKA